MLRGSPWQNRAATWWVGVDGLACAVGTNGGNASASYQNWDYHFKEHCPATRDCKIVGTHAADVAQITLPAVCAAVLLGSWLFEKNRRSFLLCAPPPPLPTLL